MKNVREPVQSRGIRTKEKILSVGRDIIPVRGYYEVTADEIARAAGLSVGTFYAYFTDKRQLFLTIVDDYITEARAVVMDGVRTFSLSGRADLPSLIMKSVRLLRRAHGQSPALMKEVLKLSYIDDEVKARLSSMDEQVESLLREALVSTGIEPAKAAAAAFVAYRASEGVIHQIVLGHKKIDEEAVLSELADLFTAYVEKLW
jgi:AcrR family transcriptional regulator